MNINIDKLKNLANNIDIEIVYGTTKNKRFKTLLNELKTNSDYTRTNGWFIGDGGDRNMPVTPFSRKEATLIVKRIWAMLSSVPNDKSPNKDMTGDNKDLSSYNLKGLGIFVYHSSDNKFSLLGNKIPYDLEALKIKQPSVFEEFKKYVNAITNLDNKEGVDNNKGGRKRKSRKSRKSKKSSSKRKRRTYKR